MTSLRNFNHSSFFWWTARWMYDGSINFLYAVTRGCMYVCVCVCVWCLYKYVFVAVIFTIFLWSESARSCELRRQLLRATSFGRSCVSHIHSRNFSNCLRRFSYHFTCSLHIQNILEKYASDFRADSYVKNFEKSFESIVDLRFSELALLNSFQVKVRFNYVDVY